MHSVCDDSQKTCWKGLQLKINLTKKATAANTLNEVYMDNVHLTVRAQSGTGVIIRAGGKG